MQSFSRELHSSKCVFVLRIIRAEPDIKELSIMVSLSYQLGNVNNQVRSFPVVTFFAFKSGTSHHNPYAPHQAQVHTVYMHVFGHVILFMSNIYTFFFF